MTARHCVRSSEAEILRDGRLRGADRRSFERHAASCAECRREIQALESLTEELRGATAPEIAELTKRRGRQQLLRDAAAVSHDDPRRPRARIALALAFAVAAAVALFVLGHKDASRAVMPAAPTAFASVDAKPGARFERALEGSLERITIADGELSIVVRHPTGHEHVAVKLPDGELEDLGTSFVVTVEKDQTTRVAVEEGLVVLRLRSQAAVYVAAGTTWERPQLIAPTTAPAVPASVEASRVRDRVRPPIAPAVPAKSASPAVAIASPVDAAKSELRDAIAAYRNGDHHVAAAKLAAFIDAHPTDSRLEDASYLRIIALQRAGDSRAARGAAHDYLARHPNGFRRREVELMLAND